MGKIIIVCLCAALLLVLPFNSLAVLPRPLVPENRIGVHTPDNGDPDGPTNGFLDDPTDWRYLVKAYVYLYVLAYSDLAVMEFCFPDYPPDLIDNDIMGFLENVTEFFENLTEEEYNIFYLLTFKMTAEMIVYFACLLEAFDIWDIDKDGC